MPYRIADGASAVVPPPSTPSEQSTNGRLHRETWPNGSIRSDDWLDDRERHHRLDGPAETRYYPSGYPQTEKWAFEGVLHREDGPAVIEYYLDGGRHEEYFRNEVRHRDDGPAELYFRADGEVANEIYFVDGERHRIDGPAIVDYDDDRQPRIERYFVRGRELDEGAFRRYIEALDSGAPHEWAWSYAHASES